MSDKNKCSAQQRLPFASAHGGAKLDLWRAAGKPAQSDYQSSAVNRTPWKGMVP